MSDYNSPIVLANGTLNTYIGFAGDDAPRLFIPSIQCDENDIQYTNDINHIHKTQLNINHPSNTYKYNQLQSIHDIEHILKFAPKQLSCNLDHNDGLTMVLSTMNGISSRTRIQIAEIIFETLEYDALLEANASVLSLYSSGRVGGIVLDSGHHKSFVSTVHAGSITHAKTLGVGGAHITKYLQSLIDTKDGVSLMDIHRIKEQKCYVKTNESKAKTYELPDGTILQNELCLCTEIMFNPQLISYTQNDDIYNDKTQIFSDIMHHYVRYNTTNSTKYNPLIDGGCFDVMNQYYNGQLSQNKLGIIELIKQCFDDHETDINACGESLGNIVLHNGNTLFDGFAKRVEMELRSVIHGHEVKVTSSPNSRISSWIGGSIIGSISYCFHDPYCRKVDWIEQGESAFSKKFNCS
eukprot:458244_1